MNASRVRPKILSTARLGALVLLGVALLFSGCSTGADVAALIAQSNAAIAQSNAALLAGQLGALPQRPGADAAANWEDANEKIETFIAAHAAHPAITAPLRIRQAMLLLSHRQFSLARAAFDAADKDNLHSERDKALKRQQAHLLWWFMISLKDTWDNTDQERARTALAALKTEQADLPPAAEIRGYMAELRFWIGLEAARQSTAKPRLQERFLDAVVVFSETLTAEDLAILRDDKELLPDPPALTNDVRRRLRARVVLAEANAFVIEQNLVVETKIPIVDQLITRKRP